MKDYVLALGKLEVAGLNISNYLKLEPIPIVVEDLGLEDGRYYRDKKIIAISSAIINNNLESLKTLCHEYRHYYQHKCILENRTKEPLLEDFKKDFTKDYGKLEPGEAMCLLIEVDAYAFTKFYLKQTYNIEIAHYDLVYNEVLNKYIIKYFMSGVSNNWKG